MLIFPVWTVWELLHVIRTKKWHRLGQLFRELVIIVSGAGLLAACVTLFILKPHVGESFIRWQPGWYSTEFKMNWLWYWFRNWGIAPYVALFGIYLLHKDTKLPHFHGFLLGCIVAFGLSNLFIWQPYIFDNTKIFAWCMVGAAISITYVLQKMWQPVSSTTHRTSARALTIFRQASAILIGFLLIFSGALDVYRVVRTDLHSYVMYTKEELELASWVRANTPPDSVWLTSDRHNNWAYNLTGRQTLMAYRGWLWTHGYTYQPVERDVSTMFTRPAQSRELFQKYGVTHISIGPHERSEWHANQAAFEQIFPVLLRTENYLILAKSIFSPKLSLYCRGASPTG
jgi:hypothetical protein